jgi:molecular chaperone DnaK
MTKVVGIDLGTTNCAIAALDDIGKPKIIANQDGGNITPSVIFFEGDNVIVGEEAKKATQYAPEKCIRFVKRSMQKEDAVIKVEGKSFSPEQASSFILKKIVKDFEQLEGKISEAVITVPANFNNIARDRTMAAAKIAGLNVNHIINEPTAAALFYATKTQLSGRIVIYDLGGGTFDVTACEVSGNDVNILTSFGIQELGGHDFDEKLIDFFEKKLQSEYNLSLFEGNKDLDKIKYEYEIEQIKKTLSKRDKAIFTVSTKEGPKNLSISRDEFEELISLFVSQTELQLDSLCAELSLKPDDFNNVLLVGGSTRIPAFKESVKNYFGKEPLTEVNVDEAVALGACIYAGMKTETTNLNAAQKSAVDAVQLQEVASHNFGTIVQIYNESKNMMERAVAIIIPRNTTLPASYTETYETSSDGQTMVPCTITQDTFGSERVNMVKIIKETQLGPLPEGRPAGQPIEVTYSYDENAVMKCIFTDVNSKINQEVDISISSSAKEIDSSIEELEAFILE